MNKNNISLVFFGSGPVAAKSLALLANNFNIETVITKPATVNDMQSVLPKVTVKSVRDKKELDNLFAPSPFSSKLAVLIDFGIIVSQKVIDYFPLGIINSHFSLLPEWRGADPITFAILSGQQTTGISLMLLSAGMDEGYLLSQAPYEIPKNTTTPQLTDKLIELSYASLNEVIPRYVQGTAKAAPQELVSIAPNKTPTYSRKLTKQDGLIDWSKSAEVLEREVRAFAEWPKSRTTIAGKDVIITKAHASATSGKHAVGRPYVENRALIIPTSDGAFFIDKLQPASKKEMSAEAFLAGHRKDLI